MSRVRKSVSFPVTLGVFCVSIGGCVAPGPTAPQATPASKVVSRPKSVAVLPDSVHWFRDSAEQKALYIETYRAAAGSARVLSSGLTPGSWGVILDVDETVLDTSEYQKRIASSGQPFNWDSWDEWIEERSATVLPGAKVFIDTVYDELHGKVVLVTNRRQDQCAATEDNLRGAHIRYDRVLCDPTGDGDKNPRFRSVIEGGAGTSPVNVLIWIGDNIQDFPSLSQQAPGDFAPFGSRYFALPNPQYGSWQSIAPR